MTIPAIIQASNMARDLVSPDCVNWENVELMYAIHGKERVLEVLNAEKDGANAIYLAHLNLAEEAINKLS